MNRLHDPKKFLTGRETMQKTLSELNQSEYEDTKK